MNLVDLQRAVSAVEPAAVLVPPRLLENIVKQSWNLSGFPWKVPHRSNFIIDRQTLFRHVDQEDLVLEPDRLLPSTVIVLAWPSSETMQSEPREMLLLKYWQELFHASVHLTLENQWSEGRLSAADVRARIAQIGPTEFEEIKSVLVADDYLPPEAGERTVYMEFAALFLEEHYFTSSLVNSTFPGLRDKDALKQMLERDVNGAELFRRTRLEGAADPVVQIVTTSQEAHEFYYKLIANSERADQADNVVLAAIQKRKAARVAPPDLAFTTMKAAENDMLRLAQRLKNALEFDDARMKEWHEDLLTLLDKADQGSHPPEAAMLYDLQKVCLDNEQDIYALDLVEWLLSMGRRPIKRPLPSQRLVRLTRHLRSATQRLTMARLSDHDRKHLAELLQSAQQSCETRLRERFRSVFRAALEDVGLKPKNPPERAAFAKMIEELIDRILAYGFLTFSDLRDTLSRNLLKLPDLSEPEDFIVGDPLLQLDRRLATLLDGVYRRGEFYLRWLERFTALNFGTYLGRMFTQYVTLPFGLAFLIMAMYLLVVDNVKTLYDKGWSIWFQHLVGAEKGEVSLLTQLVDSTPICVLLGLFLLGVIHFPGFREKTKVLASFALRPVQLVLIAGPIWLLKSPALKQAAKTWSFKLFYWYVFKPFLLASLFFWVVPPIWREGLVGYLMVFLICAFFLNTRPGQVISTALAHSAAHMLEQIRAGLLPRLLSFIVALFKNMIQFIEAMLFYVDEWLRMRKDDRTASMVLRAVLTLFWFPISYLIRFHIVVFFEPLVNPLKLPVCTIVTKFWIPIFAILTTRIQGWALPLQALAWWFMFWFPDLFGFLFWEIKENWSLYRANRKTTLGPIAMGPHGETFARLLQPGFNSGTVPKIYARLRQAERLAYQTGNWSVVRSCQEELKNVAEAVRLFLLRDFVALLNQNPHWEREKLNVGRVNLATNQVRVELILPRAAEQPAVLEFENRSGWLLAGFGAAGWLEQLRPEQIKPLHNALVTLYKLAGVDLVREQLRALLPLPAAFTDFTAQGLAVRLDGKAAPAVTYDLEAPDDSFPPVPADGVPIDGWPTLRNQQVLFQHLPVTWEDFVRSCQVDSNGTDGCMLARDVAIMPGRNGDSARGLAPVSH